MGVQKFILTWNHSCSKCGVWIFWLQVSSPYLTLNWAGMFQALNWKTRNWTLIPALSLAFWEIWVSHVSQGLSWTLSLMIYKISLFSTLFFNGKRVVFEGLIILSNIVPPNHTIFHFPVSFSSFVIFIMSFVSLFSCQPFNILWHHFQKWSCLFLCL